MLSIPAFLYLFLGSADFLVILKGLDDPAIFFHITSVGKIENAAERFEAEILKQKISFLNYGLASFLLLTLMRKFIHYLTQAYTLSFIFIILLATALISDNPVKVQTNVVHLMFGTIAAFLFAYSQIGNKNAIRNAALLVGVSTGLVAVSSLICWFFLDVDGIEFLLSDKRFGGIAGNPNVMGMVCAISIWGFSSVIAGNAVSKNQKLILFGLVACIGFVVVLTGSTTSSVLAGSAIILLLVRGIITKLSSIYKVAAAMIFTLIMASVMFYAETTRVDDSYVNSVTTALGKDATLTGRTVLWKIASEAITERPIFGWSYDTHESVLSRPLYETEFHHYHNGYLDILIIGGVILGLMLTLFFVQYYLVYRKVSRFDDNVYYLLIPVAMLFTHNVSEYSFIRNNNPLWETVIICMLVMISMLTKKDEELPKPKPKKKKPTFSRSLTRYRIA